MAAYPSLVANSVILTPGRRPGNDIRTLSGDITRISFNTLIIDTTVSFIYTLRKQADTVLLVNHYNAHANFVAFTVPDAAWTGTGNLKTLIPSGYSFLYARPLQIEDIPRAPQAEMRQNINVQLVAVPA